MSPSLFANRKFYTRPPLAQIFPSPMDDQAKPNAFFQNAVADPALKITSLQLRPYLSTDRKAPSLQPLSTGSIKVTVSADPSTQKTWSLSKALLIRHSIFFDSLMRLDPLKEQIVLEHISLRDFQNFVDYLHSSIYSPSTQFPGYRAIHVNASACLLGERFGARAYSDAALRRLYMVFEPLARLRTSNARMSSIRASDIAFVSTSISNMPAHISGIRQLLFDSVASHWTQRDALEIGAQDSPTDTTTWTEVYNTNAGFRSTLAKSLNVLDTWRGDLLRPVEEYLVYQRDDGGDDKQYCSEGAKDQRGMAVPPNVWSRRVSTQPHRNTSMVGRSRGAQRAWQRFIEAGREIPESEEPVSVDISNTEPDYEDKWPASDDSSDGET